MRHLDRDDFIKLLARRQGDRTRQELAAELGCSASFLSDIFNGKREPGPELLEQLGLERRVVYVRKAA